jgi:hypothetical protein
MVLVLEPQKRSYLAIVGFLYFAIKWAAPPIPSPATGGPLNAADEKKDHRLGSQGPWRCRIVQQTGNVAARCCSEEISWPTPMGQL